MFGKLTLGVFLALLLLTASVRAEPPYVNIEQRLTAEQLHDTGLASLSAAQLELLNQLLRGESMKVATAAMAGHASAEAPSGQGSFTGLDVQPIKSRLKGTVSGWEPGTEFQLENGQTWKVLKGGMKLRTPLQAPDVLLIPGFAGRWFLQIDEDSPKARVYRID